MEINVVIPHWLNCIKLNEESSSYSYSSCLHLRLRTPSLLSNQSLSCYPSASCTYSTRRNTVHLILPTSNTTHITMQHTPLSCDMLCSALLCCYQYYSFYTITPPPLAPYSPFLFHLHSSLPCQSTDSTGPLYFFLASGFASPATLTIQTWYRGYMSSRSYVPRLLAFMPCPVCCSFTYLITLN